VLNDYYKINAIFSNFMGADLDRLVRHCDQCQRYNVVRAGWHPHVPVISRMSWDLLGADLILGLPETEDGYTVLLVLIDFFTLHKVWSFHSMQREDQ